MGGVVTRSFAELYGSIPKSSQTRIKVAELRLKYLTMRIAGKFNCLEESFLRGFGVSL